MKLNKKLLLFITLLPSFCYSSQIDIDQKLMAAVKASDVSNVTKLLNENFFGEQTLNEAIVWIEGEIMDKYEDKQIKDLLNDYSAYLAYKENIIKSVKEVNSDVFRIAGLCDIVLGYHDLSFSEFLILQKQKEN